MVMGMVLSELASAGADEFRFMSTVKFDVGLGGLSEPTGTMMLPIGPLVLTLPVLGSMGVQPWILSPVSVSKLPSLSVWKLPARVYIGFPAALLTTKNPSPWTAASNRPPLVWRAPWVNCLTVNGVPVPKPTCVSLNPAPRDCVTRSRNSTALVLSPGVFMLARLLPTTSMAVEVAFKAESAVEKE